MASPHAVAITLSATDRATLEGWTRRRKTAQGLALRARIVLACAEAGTTNGAVAKALGISRPTVATWRKRFAERGPDGLLDEPRPGAPRRITEAQIEQAVVTTFESTPANATHWSTRSLAQAVGLSQQRWCGSGMHLGSSRIAARPSSSRATRCSSTRCVILSGCI